MPGSLQMNAGELNLGPDACVIGILPTEPSHYPCVYYFITKLCDKN